MIHSGTKQVAIILSDSLKMLNSAVFGTIFVGQEAIYQAIDQALTTFLSTFRQTKKRFYLTAVLIFVCRLFFNPIANQIFTRV